LQGSHPFEREWPDSRFVMALAQVVYHGGVAAESDIESYADLADKAIMPGLQSWATNTMTMEILAQYDISYDDIIANGGKVEHVGYDDMQRGMADRQTDFIAAFQGYPTALWINTHNSRPLRLLPVPEEIAEPILENIPGLFLAQIPAGTYDINPDEDIATIGDVTIAIAHKDYDPDVVYEFVRTTLENRESLMQAAPTLDFVATETALTGLADGEIHPGARRYYEEIGLELPN
jgi:TRAP transporter TAXI family solute receptor